MFATDFMGTGISCNMAAMGGCVPASLVSSPVPGRALCSASASATVVPLQRGLLCCFMPADCSAVHLHATCIPFIISPLVVRLLSISCRLESV